MKNLPLENINLEDVKTAYVKALTEAGLDAKEAEKRVNNMATRLVGNNGVAIGATFTLTGEVVLAEKIVDPKTKKVLGAYDGVKTHEGKVISLSQLMGISSDKGYSKSGTLDHISREKNSDKAKPVNNKVTLEVSPDYTFEDVWQPPTRNKLQLIAALQKNPDFFKDAKVTFLGCIGKQTYAKKNSELPNEFFITGDARAIVAKLWKIETPNGVNFNKVEEE